MLPRLALAVLLAAGCHTPQVGDCQVSCADDGPCPGGLVCADGMCRVEGVEASCAAVRDAGLSSTDGGGDDSDGRVPSGDCDPVTQAGCAADEKCGWLLTSADQGRTSCVPNGAVGVDDACTVGPPGETTGFDDCAAGATCAHGFCRPICLDDPDSCAPGSTCWDSNQFTDQAAVTGECEALCDPALQDCQDGTGCYLAYFEGIGVCFPPAPGAEDRTQGDPCVGVQGSCFLNGCAPGFGPFGADNTCAAFCRPVNTYLIDDDGDGEGPLVSGADAEGRDPNDCSPGRIGVSGHQCRFFQTFYVDLDQVPATDGFCVPSAGGGDCNIHSYERLFTTYDNAGGGPQGQAALEDMCAVDPELCARGCARRSTENEIADIYCDANPELPSCNGN
jgi:hypothetical protein